MKELMYQKYLSVRELNDFIYEYVNKFVISEKYVKELDDKIDSIDKFFCFRIDDTINLHHDILNFGFSGLFYDT